MHSWMSSELNESSSSHQTKKNNYFSIFNQPDELFAPPRPMSPPVRSNYMTSPIPRANSTPPTNHHLNMNQKQQMEEYNQLIAGMSVMNMNEKVSGNTNRKTLLLTP